MIATAAAAVVDVAHTVAADALVAAAAEQDQQNDDPQTVVTAHTVVIHKNDLRIMDFQAVSNRSFHVIPEVFFCAGSGVLFEITREDSFVPPRAPRSELALLP